MTEYIRPFSLKYPNAISLSMEYYENENYNRIRRCKLILFSHCLGNNDIFKKRVDEQCKINNLDKEMSYKLTKEYIIKYLEKGCLNKAINKSKEIDIRCLWDNKKFVDEYHAICYKVACNIDKESVVNSDYILNKIINNEVSIIDIASMNSKQLCPEKYKKIDEKVSKRNNVEAKIKCSEMYRCSKCKKNQTTTERVYNRSWDEGVSLKITCRYCNHSWGG